VDKLWEKALETVPLRNIDIYGDRVIVKIIMSFPEITVGLLS